MIGMPDEAWGEQVCAGIVAEDKAELTVADLRSWAKERLAPYKVPARVALLDGLPRNVMGKVTKPALKEVFV